MINGTNSILNDNETKVIQGQSELNYLDPSTLISQLKYTRKAGRYVFYDFAYNMTPNSLITNLVTDEEIIISDLIGTNQIISLQAVDFGGIISLETQNNELSINLGLNELMYKERDDSLLAHQQYFVYFINKNMYRAALNELEFLRLWAIKRKDQVELLYYLLATGYTYELLNEPDNVEDYFTQASEYLISKIEKKTILELSSNIQEKKKKSLRSHFNWTDTLQGMIFPIINPDTFDLDREISILANIPVPSKDSESLISKLLGFKPYIRIPGRYAVRQYASDIHPNSIVRNLHTGEEMKLSEFMDEGNTIAIQTLDFAGIISLEMDKNKVPTIETASNELVYGINEDSLLAHEYYYVYFMHKFKPRAALNELERIRIMTRNKIDRRIEFCYMVAYARTLMRIRYRATRFKALTAFEDALEFLYTNFTEEEIEKMSLDNFIKIHQNTWKSNWDNYLYDYDLGVTLDFYISAAILLNLASTENDYGKLLDEAINRSKRLNSHELNIIYLETKAEMLTVEGKFEKATEILNESFELRLQVNSVSKFNSTYYFYTNKLIKLYLMAENEKSAHETLNHYYSKTDFDTSPELYFHYLTSLMDIKNYQEDIKGSINTGLLMYEQIKKLSGNLDDFSQMAYIKPMFIMMVQGIYTGTPQIKEAYESINQYVFEENNDIPDCNILQKLLFIFKKQQTLDRDGNNLVLVKEILTEYNKLLDNISEFPVFSMKKTINQYLHFAINIINYIPELEKELVKRTQQITELILDSSHVLLPIKVHSIHLILSNKIYELQEWLIRVGDSYDLKPVKDIISIVNQIEDGMDLSTLKKHLLDILGYDVIHDKYASYEAVPLIKMMVPVEESLLPHDTLSIDKNDQPIIFGATDILKALRSIDQYIGRQY